MYIYIYVYLLYIYMYDVGKIKCRRDQHIVEIDFCIKTKC